MASDVPDKDKLLDALRDTEAASRELQAGAQDIVGNAQYTADMAASLRQVIQASTSSYSNSDIAAVARLAEAWSAQRDQTRATAKQVAATALWTSTTASASFTTTQSVLSLGPSFLETNKALAKEFWAVMQRPDRFKDTHDAMVRFGLDSAPSNARAPVELLRDANNAMLRPTGSSPSPTGALVPLREAIDSTVAALLRRRPTQEKVTRADKIRSIGRQCGLPGIPAGTFDRLADQYVLVVDDLSLGKQGAMQPDEVRRYFDEGLLFITALLTSLDVSKLRSA